MVKHTFYLFTPLLDMIIGVGGRYVIVLDVIGLRNRTKVKQK